MMVLAVDTSARSGALGLANDGQVLAEISLLSQENHSARLLPSIDWALARLHLTLDQVDVFGVVTGPGSFTGLRVGLATIKGFAWSLGKPIVGMSSLEVLALGLNDRSSTIVPMLDARRGKVYGAAYRVGEKGPETLLAPQDISVEDLLGSVSGDLVCFGSGARKYQEEIQNRAKGRIRFAPSSFDLPRGGVLAELTEARAKQNRFLNVAEAQPSYMRESEAKVKWKESSS